MTATAGTARTPLPQLGTHAAFPGVCLLPDGHLYRVWRDGPSHTGGSNGRVCGQLLTPGLRPAGPIVLVADWANDLRDPAVSFIDGVLHLSFFSYHGDPATDGCRAWLSTSADLGRTWSPAVQVGPAFHHLAVCSPVVKVDGILLLPAYGKRFAGQGFDCVYVFRSSDGATWPTWATAANGPADGRDYQEPTLIRLRSGPLLMALRYGNRDRIAVTVSRDGGLSWTAPTPKFPGWGKPALIELTTGPTVCVYRQIGPMPCPAVYRVSPDRGGNWNGEVVLDNVGAQMSYTALVEVADGLAAALSGVEDNATTSRIHGLHFLDI